MDEEGPPKKAVALLALIKTSGQIVEDFIPGEGERYDRFKTKIYSPDPAHDHAILESYRTNLSRFAAGTLELTRMFGAAVPDNTKLEEIIGSEDQEFTQEIDDKLFVAFLPIVELSEKPAVKAKVQQLYRLADQMSKTFLASFEARRTQLKSEGSDELNAEITAMELYPQIGVLQEFKSHAEQFLGISKGLRGPH